jgi:putative peptidoglycan lipid II flippase
MQAKFNFIYPAIAQLVVNITIIFIVYFFTGVFKIFVLPISFIISYIIGFLMIIRPVLPELGLRRYLKNRKRFKPVDSKNLFYLIIIEALSLSYILIDRYFIGKIPTGGLAALNYALVIYSLPVSIFSITLTTTMFSKFALSSVKSVKSLKTDFNNALGINSFVIIPIVFVLFFWGDVFLKVFYERGAFSASDTLQTHKVLQFYIISLVFYSAYLIAVKLFYSINQYALIMYFSIAAFLMKIIFNFLFVDKLSQNGLALSTSLIYLFLFVIAFYYAVRKINMHNYLSCYMSITYFLLNGILSYIVMKLCFVFLTGPAIGIRAGEIVSFLAIYIFNSFYLDNFESRVLKNSLGTLLRGFRENFTGITDQ